MTYEIFLFVHIAAVIVWLGGGVMMQLFAVRARRASSAEYLAGVGHDIEFLGTRVLLPASLVVVVFGFLLMWKGNWDYGELWIILALILYAISFLAGLLLLGPQSGKLGKLVAAEGFTPAATEKMQQLLLLARIDLVLLFAIAFLMVVKPGL